MFKMFEYEESEEKALSMRQFFIKYKDQLPMVAIFIGGWDGYTQFDCYDNLQVFRIHCMSSQPRVIAIDDSLASSLEPRILTIPVDTAVKFRTINSHTSVGNMQTLSHILDYNELPVQVKLACDPNHVLKMGTSKHRADSFGNLLITDQYIEHYYMVNLLGYNEEKLNNTVNLVSLSDDLLATPVTGLSGKSKERFKTLLDKLDEQVRTAGTVFDTTLGNPDMAEYTIRCIDFKTGRGGIPTVPHPQLPELAPSTPSTPPPLPGRNKSNQKEETPEPEHEYDYVVLPENYCTKLNPRNQGRNHDNTKVKDKQATKQTTPSNAGVSTKETNKNAKATGQQTGRGEVKEKPQLHSPDSRPKQPDLRLPQVPERIPKRTLKETNKTVADAGKQGHKKNDYTNLQIGRATVGPYRTASTVEKSGPTTQEVDAVDEAEDNYYEPCLLQEPRTKTEQMCPPSSQKGTDKGSKPNTTPETKSKQTSNPTQKTLLKPTPNPPSNETQGAGADAVTSLRLLTINDVAGVLENLHLGKYSAQFEADRIDGEMLSELSIDDMMSELNMKKLEALRLHRFVQSGHIPK